MAELTEYQRLRGLDRYRQEQERIAANLNQFGAFRVLVVDDTDGTARIVRSWH